MPNVSAHYFFMGHKFDMVNETRGSHQAPPYTLKYLIKIM